MGRLACADLPAFPLQLLLRRHPEWSAYPAAVIAEDKPQANILWVNERARRAGLRPNLRHAAASSLAPELRAGVVPLNEIKKETAMVTERLRRFTPDVEASHEEHGVFWLSGSGLNLLYPSPKEWAAAIHRDIEALNFRASVIVGFTRFGTYAAAKAAKGTAVFQDPSEERSAAREVELDRLDLDPDFRGALSKLGIKNVGALLSLPAGGLRERFGSKAYRLYRAASGDLWEPLKPCPVEEPVRQKLLLDDPETDSARLLFLIRRLLHPMLAALADRGEALSALLLRLLTGRNGWREDRIRPAAPTLDSGQVLDLVRIRLERLELSAGVIEIELLAEGIPATREQLRLFADRPRRDLDAAGRALARLRAEFGEQAVVRAKLTDRHLPEARFTWEPIEHVELPKPKQGAPKILVRRIFAKPIPLPPQPRTHDGGWPLLGPKYGTVERLSRPYVFSGGWWNREIQREYYFAETRRGDFLWVYYDKLRRRWFLQGRVE
ncbi:MAG: DNA polymerase Y family protein [Deltaproteobacteria bacterium]|nr:DNA polymerase Y family protein [Deltaproteobacteria bacterium]